VDRARHDRRAFLPEKPVSDKVELR
jgi:hypothetical protein